MKIVIFGANGQLGSDLVSQLKRFHLVIPATHADVEFSDAEGIKAYLRLNKPDYIINTAAYHHVEQCEQNPEMAFRINSDAPIAIAETAKELGAGFLHFSTDYVFNGKSDVPYDESAKADPLNVYGKSKLLGEQSVLDILPTAIVMRVSGLYGTNPCRAKNGLNFVQLMLKLAREKGEVKVVDDEFVSPTYTVNIAQQVEHILGTDLSGIVHATSEGACSWYDFAAEIFAYTHTPVVLNRAHSNDFPAKVPRPNYSVLENKKLKDAKLNVMLPWETALHAYLDGSPQKNQTP